MSWSITEDFMEEVDACVKEITETTAGVALVGVNKHSPSPSTGRSSTGRFAANTIVSFNSPTFVFNQNSYDPQKTQALAEGLGVIRRSKPYDVIIIQNNTPYSDKVEYGGWASREPYRPFALGFNMIEDS